MFATKSIILQQPCLIIGGKILLTKLQQIHERLGIAILAAQSIILQKPCLIIGALTNTYGHANIVRQPTRVNKASINT